MDPDFEDTVDLRPFQNLKTLSLRLSELQYLQMNQFVLPSSLEVLQLSYYCYDEGQTRESDFLEEKFLCTILEERKSKAKETDHDSESPNFL